MGMKVLDLDKSVIDQLEGFLNQGSLVALVADRDLSRSGIDVDFFNRKARMPAGPALLALRTKADLITAFVSFTEIGIHITFKGPFLINRGADSKIEVQRVTQELANAFAEDISADPASWHMQQRIFIDDADFLERGKVS
jgi:KDO2-lipid IV(A) lauroyltransferase